MPDLRPDPKKIAFVASTAPEAQASEALAALGFPRTQAQLAVAAVRREKGADLPTDLLIRESLRRLSGGR